METKFVAPSAIAFVLVFGLVGASLNAGNAHAQSDTWYVGEGAKQDMYLKYRIQEFDVHNDDPYEMTIWLKGQDEGGAWIAPTFVEFKGEVFNGTLRLGDNMAILGGSDVPDNMRDFMGGYSRSLTWLEAFSPKSQPLSLHAAYWGKIASIGGSQISPIRNEKVTVGGGTFDATVIGWHKGVDNSIWVVDGFPYPVKAETFVEVASGEPPIQYAFELLGVGTGQPKQPESHEQVPTPPLERDTGRGTYNVKLDWEPASIGPNSDIKFGVSFTDNNRLPLNRVAYSFVVTDASGKEIYNKANGFATDYTGFEDVHFDSAGPITVKVTIHSVSGVDTGAFIEEADFGLVVVPEFPVSAVIIAGAVIGLVVVMTRFRGTSFGNMFGGKNALQ